MSQGKERFSSRSEYFESLEDNSVNPSGEPTLGDVINRRFGRRDLLKGALGVAAAGALAPLGLFGAARAVPATGDAPAGTDAAPRFGFTEIAHGVDQTHHVAPGYRADVLIRWGDAVSKDAPAFDPKAQSASAQVKQFGYNNDFVGYIPLPFGSDNAEHGLLCVKLGLCHFGLQFGLLQRVLRSQESDHRAAHV